jgi:hypothetical protein
MRVMGPVNCNLQMGHSDIIKSLSCFLCTLMAISSQYSEPVVVLADNVVEAVTATIGYFPHALAWTVVCIGTILTINGLFEILSVFKSRR